MSWIFFTRCVRWRLGCGHGRVDLFEAVTLRLNLLSVLDSGMRVSRDCCHLRASCGIYTSTYLAVRLISLQPISSACLIETKPDVPILRLSDFLDGKLFHDNGSVCTCSFRRVETIFPNLSPVHSVIGTGETIFSLIILGNSFGIPHFVGLNVIPSLTKAYRRGVISALPHRFSADFYVCSVDKPHHTH